MCSAKEENAFLAAMNFSPFGSHFPAVHQFAAAKFSSEQIQAGTMLVTSASDGTIQYIRPEHNGSNFLATTSNANAVQGIPVSIATSSVNVPVSASIRTTLHSQPPQQTQQQLAAVVNQTPGGAKYHPPGTLLGWGEVPLMHHFNDASGKNIATINVPYPSQTVNSAAILAVQSPQTSGASTVAPAVWPVRLMQSVSTMTVDESELQPQDLCKAGDNVKSKQQQTTEMAKREKDSGESEEETDDSKSDIEGPSSTSEAEQNHQKSESSNIVNGGNLECHQIQLQQQGSAMADYLARLQPSTIPLSLQHFLKYQTNNAAVAAVAAVSEGRREITNGPPATHQVEINNSVPPEAATTPKKKKKKKCSRKPPRPKPGEIRLSTALDGSTLFCCPECYMAYPDREMLEQHLAGHKQERRFVCNLCGAGLKRKEHLDQHKRGHSDERPFVCTVCLKGFKRNEHLTRHYVIHSGSKNHACGECGKAFSRKDHLHKHAQTHIAKRVKAEMSQAAGLENGTNTSAPPAPPPPPPPPAPPTMNIPHVAHPQQQQHQHHQQHHHQQSPISHPLQIHHALS